MKKIVCLLFVITLVTRLFSQVNLQTGSAVFNLPIFSWQDDKSRLNSTVALNYNSGNGLKVNDIASNVGQGWSLLAGGVITRIQAGEPDDQKPNEGSGNPDDITKYPAGYLYNPTRIELGAPLSLMRYPIYKDKNHLYKEHNLVAADREMDHFAFQFNGRSGVFVLSKLLTDLGNHSGQGVMLGDSKVKISFTIDENMVYEGKGVRTTITSFSIQDENGLIYRFNQHELTKCLKTSYCDKNLNKRTQPNFKNNKVYYESSYDDNDVSVVNPWVINAWYLSEVEDVLTHRKIYLSYNTRSISTNTGASIASYKSNNSGFLSAEKKYSVVSLSKSVMRVPVISSIVYQDTHQVVFNYDLNKGRFDLNGDYPLSSIDILYQNRYLSKYQLTTSYFIRNRYGIPVSDYQKQGARLCLRSVKKIGVDLKADDPPYIFDYYLGSSTGDDFVPPPYFHLKDIWGYYNGDKSVNNDGQPISVTESLFDLDNKDLKGLSFYSGNDILTAKPGYAKNGLLRQITYPTGGSLNYTYQQNTGVLNSQSVNVGGVHVSGTSVTDGGYANGCNNPINTNYSYTLQGGNQSSIWGIEMPINYMTVYNHYQPEIRSFNIFNLACKYAYTYPGILSRDQATTLSDFQNLLVALSKVMQIVGNVSQILDVIKLVSPAGGPLSAVIIDLVSDIINIGISCLGDHHKDNETNIYYNSDLNAANPLPAQFKRVEVSDGSGTNGKTVYEFTSDDDFSLWVPNNQETFSSEQRYAYWAYGLPKRTTVYDNVGNPLKQTENLYDTTNIKKNIGFLHYGEFYGYANCKHLIVKSTSQRNDQWDDPSTYTPDNLYSNATNYSTTSVDEMKVRMYAVYTGRLELAKSYERTFKPGSQNNYLEESTQYSYSIYNYQVSKILSTQSNGYKNFKEIEYSGDDYYNSLYGYNILNVPIKITTGINKNGQDYYTDEKVTEFNSIANGDIKPSRVLERRFSQPLPTLNVPQHEIQTFTYAPVTGNLIGIKDEGNHTVANIYDYNDKYVTASVVNATPDRVAYTSFETTDYGGWTINPGSTILTNNGNITGQKSLSGSVSINVPQGDYILTFWSAANTWINNQPITGNPKFVLGPWKRYFEVKFNNITSVSLAGDNIDEVRLYPQNARMRTVTYDPLIGKTSECDENNRITYYEYDDHSRLRFIKDENGSVVKMYEYNVAKKPTGCPVTYFNLAVSEIFIKNDCPAGYVGDTVRYTIPESTYTSTISQDAVDQQVQNELNTLGQAYANSHGSCRQIFYNTALSQTFTKEGCDVGYVGTSITYTVPAGMYTSLISQADADEQAQDDMDANGQAYANFPGHASCVASYGADWVATGNENCQNGDKLIQFIDQNPNSSTYNQTQWVDIGPDISCGGTCSGEGYGVINGVCELGIKVYTGSVYDGGLYYCSYHYEWSDGVWSHDYEELPGTEYERVCPY